MRMGLGWLAILTAVGMLTPGFSVARTQAIFPQPTPTYRGFELYNWDEEQSYPVVVTVDPFDPANPPIHRAALQDLALENSVPALRREAVRLILEAEKNSTFAAQAALLAALAAVEEAKGALVRHEAALEERQRATLEASRRAGTDALLAAIADANLGLRVVEDNRVGGFLKIEIPSPEAGAWLQSQSYAGTSLYKVDEAPAGRALLSYAGPAVGLPEYHKRDRGAGVAVAVFDTGVIDHDFLDLDFSHNYDVTDGGFEELGDHGTKVAGVVNSHHDRYRGALPEAEIWDMRVSDDGIFSVMNLQQGLEYSVTGWNQGADHLVWAFGNGWTSNGEFLSTKLADWYSYMYGYLIAGGAGNEGAGDPEDPSKPPQRVSSPCAAYNTLCATGFDDRDTKRWEDDQRAPFANPGPSLDDRDKPDLSAPATSIKTTKASGNGQMVIVSGTSFAAPMVAGLAAGIQKASGAATGLVPKVVLIETAHQPDPARTREEWDEDWGWGRPVMWQAYNLEFSGNYWRGDLGPHETATYDSVETSYPAGNLIAATITWNTIGEVDCCERAHVGALSLEIECTGGGGSQTWVAPGRGNVRHVGFRLPYDADCVFHVQNMAAQGAPRVDYAIAMAVNRDYVGAACSALATVETVGQGVVSNIGETLDRLWECGDVYAHEEIHVDDVTHPEYLQDRVERLLFTLENEGLPGVPFPDGGDLGCPEGAVECAAGVAGLVAGVVLAAVWMAHEEALEAYDDVYRILCTEGERWYYPVECAEDKIWDVVRPIWNHFCGGGFMPEWCLERYDDVVDAAAVLVWHAVEQAAECTRSIDPTVDYDPAPLFPLQPPPCLGIEL